MKARRNPSATGRRGTSKPRSSVAPEESEGRGSVLFLVVVLVALSVVPVAYNVWLSRLEYTVEAVLEPARKAAEDLSRIHARQMLYFQEWLLTGDFQAQLRYRDLLADQAELSAVLRRRVEEAEVDVRGLHLPVVTAAVDWQLQHLDAFSDRGRVEFVGGSELEADQDRFELLLEAEAALLDELDIRAQAARARVSTAREFMLLITLALVALALVGTATVARLAGRLRKLVREVRGRHHDSLRVRRELDAIFDATADAVLEVDPGGTVIRINPAGAQMLGWSEADARAEPIRRLLLGATADAETTSSVVEAVREGRDVDGAEGIVTARRGASIPVLWSTRPLLDGTKRRGVVVTLTDLTEIRRATEALQRAVTAREETLAVVSHDLRSPLATVQAVGELLLEVPLAKEKRDEQLGNLLRASDRMERLIRDLLDIARIDGGGLAVDTEPEPADALLDAAVTSMEPRATAAGIALGRSGGSVDVDVLADRDRVQQVWENLISNALRHTRAGGSVVVSAESLGDRVRFAVADTGTGIPREEVPRLFDRFWSAGKPRRGGAGLGLTIVRGIVEAHGGDVDVESEPGEGATFRFTLPVARPSSA